MNIMPAKDMCKDTLIIVNSFIHDMTIGIWTGSLIVMKVLSLKVNGLQANLIQKIADTLFKDLLTISLVSFTVMVLTGAGRVFTLKNYGWTGDIARERKRLLFIKHFILGIIVVVGIIMQIQIYRGM